MGNCVSSELQQLHHRFIEWCQHPGPSDSVYDILLHPASLEKLDSACRKVLRRCTSSQELDGDIRQEALCLVSRRMQSSPVPCTDQGVDRFGGWLWRLWYRACLKAARRCQPLWMAGISSLELDSLAALPNAAQAPPLWEDVLLLIFRIPDPVLQKVLRDWAAGLTGRESARLQQLSESHVSRLRKAGAAWLRQRLLAEPRLHSVAGGEGMSSRRI